MNPHKPFPFAAPQGQGNTMESLASDLCQEFYIAARSSPGKGRASLRQAERLLEQLSERNDHQDFRNKAQEAMDLLYQWVLPEKWDDSAIPEAFRGEILSCLGTLLETAPNRH